MDVSDHLHTVYPGRRCARYLTGATDQPALHVFTLVQMSSSASSPPSPAPPATLQDCRQAARQRRHSRQRVPLCTATASRPPCHALSPGLKLPALQSSSLSFSSAKAVRRHCCTLQCVMRCLGPHCHAQQSSKAGFHSAAAAVHSAPHDTCIALHLTA